MPDRRRSAEHDARREARLRRVESSMLWSAWADALGFISELTDEQGLERRTRRRELVEPFSWNRRVGGKFGVPVELPAGCYSDDTQLRLATARAISDHGFDVEAFAKVELTVWPTYALGGGRASKAAALAMSKPTTTWSTNFFNGWTDAGGNGAAMRIQPHVWAAKHPESWLHLDDVIRNAIVTHGHPRGIIGAVLHAVALTWALSRGSVPGPADWQDLLRITNDAIVAFDRDAELAAFWRPKWEQSTQRSFSDAWHATIDECLALFRQSIQGVSRLIEYEEPSIAKLRDGYESLVEILDLRNPANRGSGTATSIAAIVLAAGIPSHPRYAAMVAAQTLGTDTDTIATMASAIVAAATPIDAPTGLLDSPYLRSEARRLNRIAMGEQATSFPYPDLLNWQAPKNQLDSVGSANGTLALAGISYLEPLDEPAISGEAGWTWTRASFGATFLVKHRLSPGKLREGNWPMLPPKRADISPETPYRGVSELPEQLPQVALFEALSDSIAVDSRAQPQSAEADLDTLVERLEGGGLDDRALGVAIRRAAQSMSPSEFMYLMGVVHATIGSRPN